MTDISLKAALNTAAIEVDRLSTIPGLTATSATIVLNGDTIITARHDGSDYRDPLKKLGYERKHSDYEKVDLVGDIFLARIGYGKVLLTVKEEAACAS